MSIAGCSVTNLSQNVLSTAYDIIKQWELVMDSKDREEKYKKQTDALYTAIGKFTVKFEYIPHELRIAITFLLHQGGLINQSIAHVMLAELTAQPLKNMFQAMIPELVDLDNKDRQIIDAILKRIQNIIEKRNDIIHCTWFVGWASQEQTDFSDVHGYKHSRGKSGALVKSFNFTVPDFDKLSEECDNVARLISRLSCCFSGRYKISQNFVTKDGEVCLPKQS